MNDLLDQQRPRVLHVLEATLGGTRQYIDNIIEASPQGTMGLAFATERADSRWPATLANAQKASWQTWTLPMSREVRPSDDYRAVVALRSIIRAFRPTVIHCHSAKAGGVGRLAALAARVPCRVLYSPHSLPTNVSTAYRFIEKALSLFTTQFVAVSSSEADEVAAMGLAKRERIAVVSPCISGNDWISVDRVVARAQMRLPLNSTVITAVGRLTEQKNPLQFADVIAQLVPRYPHLIGIWVGEGELRGAFEKRCRELGLANSIQITGWTDRVATYIAASDLVISNSRYESFGYCVAEAMAMERPVVATSVTGTRDVMDAELERAMFAFGDVRGAVELIESILEDRDLRETLVSSGLRRVRTRYSPTVMASALNHIYKSR